MLQSIYCNRVQTDASILETPQEGDTRLIDVKVRVNDWNKSRMRYTSRSGRFMYFFEFRWADYNGCSEMEGTAYPFIIRITSFMAHDPIHASKIWYRYLRLIAGGATHEEALEIVQDFVPEHLLDI